MKVLPLVELYTPSFIKRRLLVELFQRTAVAFSCAIPPTTGSCQDLIISYAQFTSRQAKAVAESQRPVIRLALRNEAKQMGTRLHHLLSIRTMNDMGRALRLIYRGLGIDLQLRGDKEVIVRNCFYSRYYDSDTCKLLSAMDEGLVAGLLPGAELSFTHRITESAPCCRAIINYLQPCAEGGPSHA